MTAVMDRPVERTQIACDACTGVPEPAEWKYDGDRAKLSYLCPHHYALFKASVDPRPSCYTRLGP